MPMKQDKIRSVEIIETRREASDIISLMFRDDETRKAKPGQYLMIWKPGVDEVPMSISTIDNDGLSSITVRVVGEATEHLAALTPGDRMGVRGPYGNNYQVAGKNPLIVAGGSGTASLLPLVYEMMSSGITPTFVLGGRSADLLLFEDILEPLLGEKLVISTDDGSKGYSGYASGYAAYLMDNETFDQVYTCGPELMMAKIYLETEKRGIPIQASLERYVKCAIGLCGNCAIGPYRVCHDGPIFDTEMLRDIREEFGRTKMDPSGQSVRVNH